MYLIEEAVWRSSRTTGTQTYPMSRSHWAWNKRHNYRQEKRICVITAIIFLSLNVQMGFLSSTYIASNVKKRLHILWVVRFMGTSIKQSSPDTRHGGAWGERRYSSYSPRHWMGVSGQRRAAAALCPGGRDPRYPLYRRLGGLQSWSGHRG
jgi:hypothetical protein